MIRKDLPKLNITFFTLFLFLFNYKLCKLTFSLNRAFLIILSCYRLTKYICVAGRVGSLKSLLKQALTDTEELLDNLLIISNTKDAEFKHIQRYKLDRSSRLLHKKS